MSNLSKEAEKLNRKKKRTWLRRFLMGLGALAAIFLVFIGLLLPATTRDEGLQAAAGKKEGVYSVLDPEFWADAFSIYALVGSSIEENILASDGNNYHISVRWEEDAGIPDGSSLSVDEILDQDVYDQYVSDTAAALGVEPETISYARFFDISILDKEGRKIQPAEGKNVDVRIELAEELSDSARAVHFADDGAVDVLDVTIGAKEPEEGEDVTGSGTSQEGTLEGAAPKEPENGNGEEGGSAAESASGADSGIVLMKSTVSFAASSFSVYAIVDAPEPVITEGTRVQNLAELARQYSYESGFYLSYGSTYYFKNTLKINKYLFDL